jgi:hypothetical protein
VGSSISHISVTRYITPMELSKVNNDIETYKISPTRDNKIILKLILEKL